MTPFFRIVQGAMPVVLFLAYLSLPARATALNFINHPSFTPENVLGKALKNDPVAIDSNPCEVFIGVFTTTQNGGAYVSTVYNDSPATDSGIQKGDVIIGFNGVSIHSHMELLAERNKSKPGEPFQMTLMRGRDSVEVDGFFSPCLPAVPKKTEEKKALVLENSLAISGLEATPNPTFGPLNIRFQAEPNPTTVKILNAANKTVYRKSLPKFSGTFSDTLDLSDNKDGNYILHIQQGEKVYAVRIVLMPRA